MSASPREDPLFPMFVTRGAAAPALSPSAYHDPAFHALERERLFDHHWHCVGVRAHLDRPGDQVALRLMGEPVVVRNFDGALGAFRNVCPHRHSLIVPEGSGHEATLRCQYHGWEFGPEGRLSHLPDGRSFKGFKAKDACLTRLRVETLGPLVFVNRSHQAAPLREALGPLSGQLEVRFNGLELFLEQRTEHPANWKIAVENAVESYHVPRIHPGTFGTYLPEAFHEHRLEERFTLYRPTSPPSRRERLAHLGYRVMLRTGLDRVHRYEHLHLFPNLLVSYSGVYCEVAVIEPVGPERCRRIAFGFTPPEVRRNPLSHGLDRLQRALVRRAAQTLLEEDSGIWPEVHQGALHSEHLGVLSAREERVTHFQRYVARAVADEG